MMYRGVNDPGNSDGGDEPNWRKWERFLANVTCEKLTVELVVPGRNAKDLSDALAKLIEHLNQAFQQSKENESHDSGPAPRALLDWAPHRSEIWLDLQVEDLSLGSMRSLFGLHINRTTIKEGVELATSVVRLAKEGVGLLAALFTIFNIGVHPGDSPTIEPPAPNPIVYNLTAEEARSLGYPVGTKIIPTVTQLDGTKYIFPIYLGEHTSDGVSAVGPAQGSSG